MPAAVRARWHDAYDAQMELWRWYRKPEGANFLGEHYRLNDLALRYQNTRRMLKDMLTSEWTRMLDLDPIYVSAEMCEVVTHASETFQPEPLLETDMLTPRGFLYFAEPFLVPDRHDEPTSIKAASWISTFAVEDEDLRRWAETTLRDAERLETLAEVEQMLRDKGSIPSGISLTLYQDATLPSWQEVRDKRPDMHYPTLLPMHLTPWYYGMSFDGNDVDLEGKPTGAGWWWRIIQSTFRLMQQKISTKTRYRPDRASRREARKAGVTYEPEVVVVRLRREEPERKGPPQTSANYSHRFLRTGHWRNQWYPSISQHRQIYIDPTIVGDPNLPLIIRPRRVFQWER